MDAVGDNFNLGRSEDRSEGHLAETLSNFPKVGCERWPFNHGDPIVDPRIWKREWSEKASVTIVSGASKHDMLAVLISVKELKVGF